MAEQMFYAKFHRLPDPKKFSVIATETAGTPLDTAEYELQIQMDSVHATSKLELNLDRPIWSPEIYEGVAQDLAVALGLTAGNGEGPEDTTILSKLTDGKAETIEERNEALSRQLEDNFTDPRLHEAAAVLMGTFTLRERSGFFYDIRFPLSRLTAHLSLAHFLNGAHTYGINGQVAEAMLLTLMGDQAAALARLDTINTNDAAVATFIRVLRIRNSRDFSSLGCRRAILSPIESIEWFSAQAGFIGSPIAWLKLNDIQKQNGRFYSHRLSRWLFG